MTEKKHHTLSYVRMTTKDRSVDRFLTTQVRSLDGDERTKPSELFFLVEIAQPWTPSAHIGQTIINTVIREYRRAESTSQLGNFELALRKTNGVLAQITQTGETDWIGNLSSIIALVTPEQIHLAQTGRGRVFLLRDDRFSDLTDGLEEASLHPLTTYTNITSGVLESGDRVLVGSSLLADGVDPGEIKLLLGSGSELAEVGRDIIRQLQREHQTKIQAFLFEVDPPAGSKPTTLFLDQAIDTPLAIARRFFVRSIVPHLKTTGAGLKRQTNNSGIWLRDWLVPHLINWSNQGKNLLIHQTKTWGARAEPLIRRAKEATLRRLPQKHPLPDNKQASVIYQVHHYEEQPANKTARPIRMSFRQAFRLPQVSVRLPTLMLSPRQRLLLGLAFVALLIVAAVAQSRREQHIAEQQAGVTSTALAEAQTAQKAAERAFTLGEKDEAKTQFVLAITKAEVAELDATTKTEATAIRTQSQTLLNQLMHVTRLEENLIPITTLTSEISGTLLTDTEIVTISKSGDLQSVNVADGTTSEAVATNQPAPPANATTRLADQWYLAAAADQRALTVNLSTKAVQSAPLAGGTWPAAVAATTFGTNLYLLDTGAGQIWKHSETATGFTEGKPYLKTNEPTELAPARDLAIDGDVFVLMGNGTVTKYGRGERDQQWHLAELPTPWHEVVAPVALFTSATSSSLLLLENRTDTHPARFIEFDKNGTFIGQLVMPQEWRLEAWDVDLPSRTAVLVSDHHLYRVVIPNLSQ